MNRLQSLAAHVVVPPCTNDAAAPACENGLERKAASLLVANRGEIAIRICRAASQLGIRTVAVYATDDATCLHTKKADVAVELAGAGQGSAAYLNQGALLQVATAHGCTLVHCGYGFLSENAEFAAAVENAGLTLVGPPSAAIALFGAKTKARELAQTVGVPLLPGTTGAVTLEEATQFFSSLGGAPMMIKALAGGGGRGMRAVFDADELEDAFERCQSEALAAFGDAAVFVEKLMVKPRHIEVQVLADGQGGAIHLYERECSVQRQNQKVVEIAPSPSLPSVLRDRLVTDAVTLVAVSNYRSAATVEFLVEREMTEDSAYAFMEVNPRLQVEHTVTEEILDIDIVQLQLHIAAGASLADLGFADGAGTPRGYAIQARVNMETMNIDGSSTPTGGKLVLYEEPGGRGVRVDSMGYVGYVTSANYDSLLAKVICHSSSSFEDAIQRTYLALCEFAIVGVDTNIEFIQNLLCSAAFQRAELHTAFIADNIEKLLPASDTEHQELHFQLSSADSDGRPKPIGLFEHETRAQSLGACTAAMTGTIVSLVAEVGEHLTAGQPLAVISAMKMENTITAEHSGTLTTWAVEEGQAVSAGEIIATMDLENVHEGPTIATQSDVATVTRGDGDWSDVIDGIHARRAAVVQHRRNARFDRDGQPVDLLNIYQRCELLCDPDTLRPIGRMAGKPEYDENGEIASYTPANFVLAHGKVAGRRIVCAGEDFAIGGGSPNSAGLKLSTATEKEALRFRCPLVRLHEGGGGSVAGTKRTDSRDTNSRLTTNAPSGNKAESNQSPVASVKPSPTAATETQRGDTPKPKPKLSSERSGAVGSVFADNRFTSVGEVLATVPVACAALGSVAGLPASRFVASHFTVMTANAQVLVAGPRVVERAWEGVVNPGLTKQELGGPQVHLYNGCCDNFAQDEDDALRQIRQFLSYMPQSVWEIPERQEPMDDSLRCEPELNSIIPNQRKTSYDMRRIIELVVDKESWFEIGPFWGRSLICGLARLDGYPVGIFANDNRFYAGAMSADASQKVRRLIDLCQQFHIPIVTFQDEPGFMIGPEAEAAATIRYGTAFVLAAATCVVPWAVVMIRKNFGVAGAGHFAPDNYVLAWPSVESGALPIEGGVAVAFRREIEAAANPDAKRKELEEELASQQSPFPRGEGLGVHELIPPEETRPFLCDWADSVQSLLPQLAGPVAFPFRAT